MENKQIIHAVAFQSGPHWVAQCLEFDIATQATSLDDLMYELERILAAHVILARREKLAPFADIPRAPRRFWDLYRQAGTRLEPVRQKLADLPIPEEERPELEVRAA